jgi:hypothetical protein
LTPPWQDRPGVWYLLVAAVAVALYARTVTFGWVYDDQMEIVLNPWVHSLGHLPEIFTSTVWAGSGMETYLYRPLALVSYALNHLISGLRPWSYHLVNVGLHALASILVVRVGRMWGLSMAAAGVGGILFAVHPAHVEVVAAVFGRKDLLAGVFVLAMVLGHRWALARGEWRPILPLAPPSSPRKWGWWASSWWPSMTGCWSRTAGASSEPSGCPSSMSATWPCSWPTSP